MRATSAVALGFCAAVGCTKKPSAEECARAWRHVSDILVEMAIEDVKRIGAELPDDARQQMAADLKAMQGEGGGPKAVEKTTFGKQVQAAQIAACQDRPRARAACILDATTVEQLVKVCGMKASSGFRGGVSLSWPD